MEDICRVIHDVTVKAAIRFKTCAALLNKPSSLPESRGIILSNESFPNNLYILGILPTLQEVQKELILKTVEKTFSKDKAARNRSSNDCDPADRPNAKRTKNY
jgi:hypothetical protein